MKHLLFILFTSSTLLSCTSTPKFPEGRWLLETPEGDAYFNINDTLITFETIQYSCDTTVYEDDYVAIDTFYYENNIWTIIPKTFSKNIKFEIEKDSETRGFLTFFKDNRFETNFSGELSIPNYYFPIIDDLSYDQRLTNWGHNPTVSDIKSIERQIEKVKISSTISKTAKNLIEYLDSLEIAMIATYKSDYEIKCIHKDAEVYVKFASDFLVNDAAIPTEKYFSAITLKERLNSYYEALESKKIARDLFDFTHIAKGINDLDREEQEVWEVQEFYNQPYYNVILTFRQIKLAVYQIEKYKD